jgi:hypothetical protein
MAIAYDNSTAGGKSTGTSQTFAHTCTGDNLVIIVGILTVGSDTVSGVTYNGVAMTRVDAQAGGGECGYLYILANPATGANNVVISTSSSVDIYGFAASYTGCAQGGQPDAHAKNSATATSLTAAVNTGVDNCWLVMFARSQSAYTVTGGTTERVNDGTHIYGLFDSNGAKTPAGSYSLGLTFSSTVYIYCVASIKPPQMGGSFFNFFV